MRIGYDAKRLFLNNTGLGNYSRTLVRYLSQAYSEHEYFLYSPRLRENEETRFFLERENCLCRTPSSRSFSSLWRSFGVNSLLKSDQIDVYHGLSHEIPVSMSSKIYSIVTIHDMIYKTYPYMFPWIDRQFYDFKFRYACEHAQKIVAISRSTKNDIVHYFNVPEEKIEVVYQWVNELYYEPQPMEVVDSLLENYHLPQEFALYVGSLNSRKNALSLIEAYRCLPDSSRIPLVLIGDGGAYKEKIIRRIHDCHLENTCILISSVNDTRVLQAFYQKAKIFMYPSFYEGFGLPVCESILSGTPVLTSNISSLPEAGGPDVFYADPYRVEDIADKIEFMLTHEEEVQRSVESSLRYVKEHFVVDKLGKQMMDLYLQGK